MNSKSRNPVRRSSAATSASLAASRSPVGQPSRPWICTYVASGLAGAALASSVLITADATSVYEGESLPQVLMLLAAGLVASFGKLSPLPEGPKARLPLALLAAIVGWLAISSISATWLADGRAAWNGFWHIAGLIVFGCLFSRLCRWPNVARVAAQLLVIGAMMLAVHAVHQYFVSMPEARARYEQDPERELAELGLDAPPGSALRMQFESRLQSPEPLATFALTNSLAVVLSAALIFQAVVIIDGLRRRPQDYLAIATSLLAWLFVGAACLLTKSRTAFLSMGLIAILTAFVAWRMRRASTSEHRRSRPARVWIAVGVAGCVAAFAAVVGVLSRDTLILSEAPKSVAFRLEYWQATSKMILDHPLVGVGLGNFQSYYPRYKLQTASETIADPHNWLFDIAACCSLLVLALVLISLAIVLLRNYSLLREQSRGEALQLPDALNASSNESLSLEQEAHRQSVAQALWIGAGAGWVLTAALQWILHESIDLEAAGLGLIVSLVVWALMRRAPAPSEAVLRGAGLAAATTMLVCLLATGSWQASGIALPLVAWLAISSFGRNTNDETAEPSTDTAQRAIDWRSAWQPAVMVLLLAGFIFQTWRPVNSSWTHEQQVYAASARGDLDSALQSARQSREADPINPMPYRLVVQMLVYRIDMQPPERLEALCDQVESELAALLECDPVPDLPWNYAAESAMTLAAAAESHAPSADLVPESPEGYARIAVVSPLARRMLERAAEYQQGAVERYPSSVAHHAQLGVILTLLDR
ncbi:MAG: O-antigen ligase family protein, partial [Aureliella sp.]